MCSVSKKKKTLIQIHTFMVMKVMAQCSRVDSLATSLNKDWNEHQAAETVNKLLTNLLISLLKAGGGRICGVCTHVLLGWCFGCFVSC